MYAWFNGIRSFLLSAIVMVLLPCWPSNGLCDGLFSFGDVEKPKPEFTRAGDQISAKLIPRAKSTSVEIVFSVAAGGKIDAVKGVDFYSVDRPGVDVKNFKSAVFEIGISRVAPGGTATLSVASDFFTMSTAFYVFNPKRDTPWIKDVQSENQQLPDHIRQLLIQVKDGGDLDADGRADGRITVIGGPRDSFWGYALGTLFIRFFGIFIVLSVLMLGMIISGLVFKRLLREKDGAPVQTTVGAKPEAPPAVAQQATAPLSVRPDAVPDEIAAAIAVGLHLRSRERASEGAGSSGSLRNESGWVQEGRQRIMSDRMTVFRRGQ
jgi:hypothetical protein